MSERPLPTTSLDQARERAVERLSVHYARDQLTLDELESRLERAYAARSPEALEDVLVGLPVLAPAAAPAALKPDERRTYLAVMSGVVRRGAWVVPEDVNALAFMGGFEDQVTQPASNDPDAPVVRLTGFALHGRCRRTRARARSARSG